LPGLARTGLIFADNMRTGKKDGDRMLDRLKERARQLRRSITALYLAARHPRTPWYAKVLAVAVCGYAFSPIDLIPDPIPVLGYLDDLLLLPVGVWLTVQLIPPSIWAECQAQAKQVEVSGPRSWIAAIVIVLVWLLTFYVCARLIGSYLSL